MRITARIRTFLLLALIIAGIVTTRWTLSAANKSKQLALDTVKGGAIVLTFDDHSIDQWYAADSILHPFGWKATFFVSKYAGLPAKDRAHLAKLQARGHEIGSHGARHLNAVKYLSSHSQGDYLAAEIVPSLQAMIADGLHVDSFAYPHGAHTSRLDDTLLKYFSMIRGTTYHNSLPLWHNNYANGSRVVYGLGIDRSYGNSLPSLLSLLAYARDHDKIVIFYGHHLQADDSSEQTTGLQTLTVICRYAVDHGIRFMTMRELAVRNGPAAGG